MSSKSYAPVRRTDRQTDGCATVYPRYKSIYNIPADRWKG